MWHLGTRNQTEVLLKQKRLLDAASKARAYLAGL